MPTRETDWRSVKGIEKVDEGKVSRLRAIHQKDKIIAILCSDLHLSSTTPACRAETDWYAVMGGYLRQLSGIRKELAGFAGVAYIPIICAGDVFHNWDSSPELINWAMRNVPFMYVIRGQHDTPNHQVSEIHRSAFHTLALAKIYHVIERKNTHHVNFSDKYVSMLPFPWGDKITECPPKKDKNEVSLMIAHKYLWIKGHEHVKAEQSSRAKHTLKRVMGSYDAAVFGDNHSGFLTNVRGKPVLNCGTFMRRRLTEINYKPSIGLLHESGRISKHYLDVSQDKFVNPEKDLGGSFKVARFLNLADQIRSMGPAALDYATFVIDWVSSRKIEPKLKRTILSIMEEVQREQGTGIR